MDGWQAQPLAAVVEHVFGAGGATASDEGADGEEGVEVADAAGGFDLDMSRRMLAHEGEIGGGCAAGAVAGAGFDPVGF